MNSENFDRKQKQTPIIHRGDNKFMKTFCLWKYKFFKLFKPPSWVRSSVFAKFISRTPKQHISLRDAIKKGSHGKNNLLQINISCNLHFYETAAKSEWKKICANLSPLRDMLSERIFPLFLCSPRAASSAENNWK